MRILVTGANGFIGSTLVETALRRGWQVTAAVRPGSDRTFLQLPDLQLLETDFSEKNLPGQLRSAGRFDAVIHNAGATKAPDLETYLKTNLGLTQRLVEALRTSGTVPDKFLFVSSLAAKGPTGRGEKIRPETPAQPITGYGKSKLAAEQYLENLTDFPWLAVQPTAVFGPRERDLFIVLKMAEQARLQMQIGFAAQQLSFVFSKDLVDVMLAAAERGQLGKKYIVSDGREYDATSFQDAVGAAVGKRTLRLKLPTSLVRLIAATSETLAKKGTTPTLNRDRVAEFTAPSWWCDAGETFRDLALQPRYDLAAGLAETVTWYRENGWI